MASVPGTECTEIRLLLSAMVDGEATPDERTRAEAHVAGCDACASHLAFLRLTATALRRAPDAFPPADLAARIAAATYARPTLSQRIQRWLAPAPVRALAGAVAAAGVAAVLILPRLGGEAPGNAPSDGAAPSPAGATAHDDTAAGGSAVATAASGGAKASRPVTGASAAASSAGDGRANVAAAPLPAGAPAASSGGMVARAGGALSSPDAIRSLPGSAAISHSAPAADRGRMVASGSAATASRRPRGAALVPLGEPASSVTAPAAGQAVASAAALPAPTVAPTPAAVAAAKAQPSAPRTALTPYSVADAQPPKLEETEARTPAPSTLAATTAAPDVSLSAPTAAAAPAEVASGGPMRFAIGSRHPSNNAVIDTREAMQRAECQGGGLSQGSYTLGQNERGGGSVVTAPVQ